MSHRLQVLIPDELDLALTQAAARDRVSKGEFVRSALEAALDARILEVDPVSALAELNAPICDIDDLLREVDERFA